MKYAFDFVFVMIGLFLPYDIRLSSMITSKNNRVILFGGFSLENGRRTLNTLIELEGVTSKWKEFKLPLKKFRYGHIAFKGTNKRMKIFCGKRK